MNTHTTVTNHLQCPSSVSSSGSGSRNALRRWTSHPDDSSAEDEEEVLFDLDEAALAQLPVHLQHTMREIQCERVHRLSQRPESITMSMSVRMNMTMTMTTGIGTGTGTCIAQPPDSHADRWVRNIMARISTGQERENTRDTQETMGNDHHVDANPFERLLGPADRNAATCAYTPGDEHMLPPSGRYYDGTMSGRNVFLEDCEGSFERNALERCSSGRRKEGPATEHISEIGLLDGGEAMMQQRRQRQEGRTGQFRKTIITAVRVRVKKSFQKVGMLLRK